MVISESLDLTIDHEPSGDAQWRQDDRALLRQTSIGIATTPVLDNVPSQVAPLCRC